MATREIKICDICKSEVNNVEQSWHSMTVHCVVRVPEDGANGGKFTGDWCVCCRIKLNNFIQSMKCNSEEKKGEEPHE